LNSILGQLARSETARLVTELGYALIYEGLVELIDTGTWQELYGCGAVLQEIPLVVYSAPTGYEPVINVAHGVIASLSSRRIHMPGICITTI